MMNQSQVKYARERASAIKRRREEKLTSTYSGDDKLDNDGKARSLKEGRFKVEGKSYRWYDRVVFLDEPGKGMIGKAYQAALKKLREDYDHLIDELVLGDCDVALGLLRAFEAAETK